VGQAVFFECGLVEGVEIPEKFLRVAEPLFTGGDLTFRIQIPDDIIIRAEVAGVDKKNW